MTWNRRALALSFGLASMVGAATIAQTPPRSGQALVVEDATIDWIQRSDVSALRPGVIEKMELLIGDEATQAGAVIGKLYSKAADLAVEEARIAAISQGGVAKALAQKENALSVVARNKRLSGKGSNLVSAEEMQKSEAELKVAEAMVIEANDALALAQAKLKSAEQTVEEHIIRAPFPGVVFDELKHAGESVNSNEAVVRLGNLDRLRVWAYIPVEFRQKVAEGCDIEIQPRLGDVRTGTHPIENKRFRGKITFVDPKLQPVSGSEVRVYAEVDNASHELGPNMKATMTIQLKPEGTASYAAPAPAGAPTSPALAPASPTSLGARPNPLPPLPRR